MKLPPRFTLLGHLGRGGFGTVFHVYDHQRQEEVAVKHLDKDGARSLFKQEGTQHARLSHPNLVRIHELLEVDGEFYIVMQYVPGVSLIRAFRETPGRVPRSRRTRERLSVSGVGSGLGSRTLPSHASLPLVARRRRIEQALENTPQSLTELALHRLRELIRQLVDAVEALHRSGRVHRDLKPANILVTARDEVVVVDLGLAVQTQALGASSTRRGQGTPTYMAPEQYMAPEHGNKAPLGPALDWYAVGVILYELLAGVPPFSGAAKVQWQRKRSGKPVPFSARGLSYPEPWWRLTRALLKADPAKRADGTQIRSLLELPMGSEGAPVPPVGETPLVGREAFLAKLEQLISAPSSAPSSAPAGAGQRVVVVSGQSGIGKSAVLEQLRWRLDRAGTLVFPGTCYERGDIPFKALDESLAALVSYVTRRAPRLRTRIPDPVRSLVEEQFGDRPGGRREAPEQLFQAVTEFIVAVAAKAPVVFLVDDLQWGDRDSGKLLRQVLQASSQHPISLVGTMHPEAVADSPFLEALQAEGASSYTQTPASVDPPPKGGHKTNQNPVTVLELGPLEQKVAQALSSRLHPTLPEDQRAAAVQNAEGSPLFLLKLLVTAANQSAEGRRALASTLEGGPPRTLQALLERELEQLSEAQKTALHYISLALRPLPLDALRAMMPEVPGLQSLIEGLIDQRLLRSSGSDQQYQLRPYHLQHRRAMQAHMTPPQKRAYSRRLAEVLEKRREEPASLAVYYEDGELWDRAFFAYRQASEEAVNARSVEVAVSLHARALELHGRALEASPEGGLPPLKSPALELHHIRLLMLAGHSAKAAEGLLLVVQQNPELTHGEKINHQRAAVLQYLSSGLLEEGRAVLRELLKPHGLNLEAHPARKVLSVIGSLLLIRVLWPFRHWLRLDTASVASYVDVCGNVVQSIGLIDPLTAAWFQGLQMRVLLRMGDPERLLHALFMEIFCYSAGGSISHGWVDRMRQEAEALMRKLNAEALRGRLLLSLGKARYHQSSWKEARALLQRALLRLQDEPLALRSDPENINELRMMSGRVYLMEAAIHMGDFALLKEQNERVLTTAEARQYLSAQVHVLTVSGPWLHLVEDQPKLAQQLHAQGMKQWPHTETHLQHFFSDQSRVKISLYQGRNRRGLRQLERRSGKLLGRMLLIPQHMRILRVSLSGFVNLAFMEKRLRVRRNASVTPLDFRSVWLLLVSVACMALLWLEGALAARASALLLRASLLFMAGWHSHAHAGLERAALAFDQADMAVWALYARWGMTVCRACILEEESLSAEPVDAESSQRSAPAAPSAASRRGSEVQDQARAQRVCELRALVRQLRARGIVDVVKFARLYLPLRGLIEGPDWLNAAWQEDNSIGRVTHD